MQMQKTEVNAKHRTIVEQTPTSNTKLGGMAAIKSKKPQQEFIRGGIYLIDFGTKSTVQGSEQSGVRPAVVLQNDVGNKYSPTIIVAPITKSKTKRPLPTHVPIDKYYLKGLNASFQSIALLEQVKTVDKVRVVKHLNSKLEESKMREIDKALMISFGLK